MAAEAPGCGASASTSATTRWCGDPRFGHPVERELAVVFDEHGIAWEYEPHNFVVGHNPDGSVREAFTPDFYLPGLDLYVECTVLGQRLTNRKRRKARKARLRAGVKVEVLCRRNIDRLARRWKLARLADAMDGPGPRTLPRTLPSRPVLRREVG